MCYTHLIYMSLYVSIYFVSPSIWTSLYVSPSNCISRLAHSGLVTNTPTICLFIVMNQYLALWRISFVIQNVLESFHHFPCSSMTSWKHVETHVSTHQQEPIMYTECSRNCFTIQDPLFLYKPKVLQYSIESWFSIGKTLTRLSYVSTLCVSLVNFCPHLGLGCNSILEWGLRKSFQDSAQILERWSLFQLT